ncbi:Radical SAM domain protein [Spirochaeta thermophila DSM 6578]|uniref:Radical SAM domain protein n=1 Tax=Winmispira thermophila (strain ATCC 700085 / DSM 6578 / Z-1203) TaxID=869211 RepID=G0GFL4_WINT7|nr:B12-binding domain-containing radical SAM protein [Spirochaeta thermophila]AEJ62413.1 Radical SAM domain protein [Spirochaeta thermophila DSM 6578]
MPPSALLIQPPVYDFALFDLFLRPYGLLRVGRWLEEAGYEVRFLDCLDYRDVYTAKVLGAVRRRPDGTGKFFRIPLPPPYTGARRRFARYGILPERVEEILSSWYPKDPPSVVLIGSGMTYWYPGVKEAADLIRRRFPGSLLVVGGVYASLLPRHCEEVVRPDVIVQGDDLEALRSALGKEGLPVPQGVVPDRPLLLERVWREAGVLRLHQGCPYRCTYCASSRLSRFVPGRGDALFDLLMDYRSRCSTSTFAFYDDALLVGKEEGLLPFLEQVLSRLGSATRSGLSFYVPNALHARFLDRRTASLMVRAGFREVRVGFESAEEGFHTRYDRKVTSGEFLRAVEILREAGFPPSSIVVYVLVGLPGQRSDEVERTLSALEDLPVLVSLAEYSPIPGTSLWEESVRRSRYPIAHEPLFHNNSIFPLEWEGFTFFDLECLKRKVRERNARIRALSPSGNDP